MAEIERITVVKLGGRELAPGPTLERVAAWAARSVRRGARLVLVHGGGEEISERAAALGLPTEKIDGQRVTSAPMLEVVVEVLAGRINSRLVAALGAHGVASAGLTGLSGGMMLVRPIGRPPGALGFVGEPVRVRPHLLDALLEEGVTPVVAPIGADRSGQTYNVNADLAAAGIARALRADLALVTDVAGVLGSDGRPIPTLSVPEAHRLMRSGVARGGMIPKLTAAERSLTSGASAWIGDLDGLEAPAGTRGTRLLPLGAPASRGLPRRARSGGRP